MLILYHVAKNPSLPLPLLPPLALLALLAFLGLLPARLPVAGSQPFQLSLVNTLKVYSNAALDQFIWKRRRSVTCAREVDKTEPLIWR